MIRQPEDIQYKEKKIRMLIAGYPGIGKSTLGLSAPNALHIDIDFGIDRIEPQYRRPTYSRRAIKRCWMTLSPKILKNLKPWCSIPEESL